MVRFKYTPIDVGAISHSGEKPISSMTEEEQRAEFAYCGSVDG
jgi:hypothetical protein